MLCSWYSVLKRANKQLTWPHLPRACANTTRTWTLKYSENQETDVTWLQNAISDLTTKVLPPCITSCQRWRQGTQELSGVLNFGARWKKVFNFVTCRLRLGERAHDYSPGLGVLWPRCNITHKITLLSYTFTLVSDTILNLPDKALKNWKHFSKHNQMASLLFLKTIHILFFQTFWLPSNLFWPQSDQRKCGFVN